MKNIKGCGNELEFFNFLTMWVTKRLCLELRFEKLETFDEFHIDFPCRYFFIRSNMKVTQAIINCDRCKTPRSKYFEKRKQNYEVNPLHH